MEDKLKIENENLSQQNKKNNSLMVIIVILVMIIFGLVIFITYDKLLNPENNNSNSENQEELDKTHDDVNEDTNEEENKNEVKEYSGMYIIQDYENLNVYKVDIDEYLKNGKKDTIISDIGDYDSFVINKNKIFYFNKNSKLSVYNIDNKQTTVYDVDSSFINFNTAILPGDDYTILTDSEKFLKLDMKTKEVTEFKVNTVNYTLLYDDTEKTLYYMNGYSVESYNVVSGVITKEIGEGYPIYVDDEYVYMNNIDSNDSNNYLNLYDKKTKKTISLKYNNGNILSFLAESNGDRYFSTEGLLVKIDKSNKINIIHDSPCSMMLNTNSSIFIAEYELINAEGQTYGGDLKEVYEYDYETGKKEKIDNQYVKNLFDDCIVHYLED